MTIVHLLNEFWFGGIQETVYSLCWAMSQHTHYVLGHTDGPMRPLFEVLPHVRVQVGWDTRYTGLATLVETETVDLVHKQMGGGDISPMLAPLCEPRRLCAVVESMHCPRACRTPPAWVDAVCVASRYTEHQQTDAYAVHHVHYGVVPAVPVPDRATIRAHYHIPDDALVLGRVGRLSGSKLVHETILIAQQVMGLLPNVFLLLGGSVAQDEGPAYARAIHRMMGSHPRMRFVGEAPTREYRAALLNATDVVLYPTHDEGFGMIFAEAFQQGKPVATYDTGANAEVVGQHGGITVPWQDDAYQRMSDLAAQVPDVLLRHEHWEHRVRRHSEHFTATRYGADMQRVYDEALTRFARRSE